MSKHHRAARWLALSIASALALTGATFNARGADPEPAPFRYHDPNILGTSMDLQVVAPTKADADKVHQLIMDEIERLRKILSTYDATTELSRVNASTDPVKVSKELIDVLKLYDQWQQRTAAFSGHLGKITALWEQAVKNQKMPTHEEVVMASSSIKKDLWKIDATAGTVQRVGEDLINIDSLGKGFIVSKAAAHGREGVPAARGLLLDIGGDITALGTHSATKIDEWVIDVANPENPGQNAAPLTTLKLAGMSVATSGGYERHFDIGKLKLSHIIDPRTGYPADYVDAPGRMNSPVVQSATVIAKDNATANALATSLCVLPPDQGLALIAATPGAECLIVLSGGRFMRSPGFSRYETIAVALAGKAWPDGSQMSLDLQYTTTNIRERPYVAIWVENEKGEHVATIAQWGNNQRYAGELSSWARACKGDVNIFRAVTRATRPSGKYSVTWDGHDQNGILVPAGTYKISVEMAYEHNGHSVSSTTLVCGAGTATANIPATRHFAAVDVAFGPKGK